MRINVDLGAFLAEVCAVSVREVPQPPQVVVALPVRHGVPIIGLDLAILSLVFHRKDRQLVRRILPSLYICHLFLFWRLPLVLLTAAQEDSRLLTAA